MDQEAKLYSHHMVNTPVIVFLATLESIAPSQLLVLQLRVSMEPLASLAMRASLFAFVSKALQVLIVKLISTSVAPYLVLIMVLV